MRERGEVPYYEPTQPFVTRRRLLVGAAALVGVSAATGICLLVPRKTDQRLAAPRRIDSLAGVDVVSEIKKFESQVGNNVLSLHEAKNYYLPLVAEFFVREMNVPAIGTKATAQEVLDSTFIVRRDFNSQEEGAEEFAAALTAKDDVVLSSPPVRRLAMDYPDLQVSAKMARGIVGRMNLGALGWVDDGKIFLVFDRVNNKQASYTIKYSSDTEEERPFQQFQGAGHTVKCSPPSPVVKLRSVFLHELVHWEGDKEWQPLEQDVVDAYQRVENKWRTPAESVVFSGGRRLNFIADFSYTSIKGGKMETGFDEFVTDYIASNMAIANALPYTLGYHGKNSPGDFENFRKVLQQSRISEPELTKFHHESKLREVLLRIAKGARDIHFSNEQEMLDFSVGRLLYWSSLFTVWKEFKVNFPAVDDTRYEYYVDPSRFKPQEPFVFENSPEYNIPGVKLGCIQG